MEVKFTVTAQEDLATLPITDGQIIAIADQPGYYYDMLGVRFRVSGVIALPSLPETGLENTLYCVKTSTGGLNLYIWSGSAFVSINSGIIDDNVVSTTTSYSSSKVLQMIQAIHQFEVKFVDELPDVGEPHTIYFVRKSEQQAGYNYYDEYMYIEDKWEKIGDTYLKVAVATIEEPGIVKPDGTTITVTTDGTISSVPEEASEISYSNETSQLSAKNVQAGIDELAEATDTLDSRLTQTDANLATTTSNLNTLTTDIKKIVKCTSIPADRQSDTLYLVIE